MPDSPQDTPPENPFRLGIAVWLATGGWVGFVPYAPGTFGSLLGIPLVVAVASLPEWWERLALVLLVCICGVRICTVAARRLGGAKDPQMIVLDEIAAMPIALFGIPLDLSVPAGFTILALGFVLFRLFDITKPPPARQMERLPEGLGIMADDWVAGIYANIALRILLYWNPGSIFTA